MPSVAQLLRNEPLGDSQYVRFVGPVAALSMRLAHPAPFVNVSGVTP